MIGRKCNKSKNFTQKICTLFFGTHSSAFQSVGTCSCPSLRLAPHIQQNTLTIVNPFYYLYISVLVSLPLTRKEKKMKVILVGRIIYKQAKCVTWFSPTCRLTLYHVRQLIFIIERNRSGEMNDLKAESGSVIFPLCKSEIAVLFNFFYD